MATLSGFGTTFLYGVSGSSASIAITNIKSVKTPDPKMETLDTTVIGATGRYKTKTIGLIEPGPVEIECYYDETNYAAHFALLGSTITCAITAEDTGHQNFSAIVTNVGGLDFAADKVPMYKITAEATGVVTFTSV